MRIPEGMLVWRACACYVWPISPLHRAGRCGWCATYADQPADAPTGGVACPR